VAGVAECAVIGVPDEKWGEVGKALIVPRDGVPLTAAEALAGLDGRIARYKVPRHGEIVETLPRNASGKLLKAQLRREFGQRGTT
jgi:fatty-acyl-CoA synthase